MTQENQQIGYRRLMRLRRFALFILVIAMIGLAVTGLPQKYADRSLAHTMISWLGHVESVRILHRFFAILLMLDVIYFTLVAAYQWYVREQKPVIGPTWNDWGSAWNRIRYIVGMAKKSPRAPLYNFTGKLRRLVMFLGLILMIVTGFALWNPVATTKLLPGEVVPASRSAHSEQALLLVILLIIWYGYAIVRSPITLLERKSQTPISPTVEPETMAQRARRFWPIAGLVVIVLLGGLYWFVAFEDSAVQTVSRRHVLAFSPEVQLEEGDPAVGEALWTTLRCSHCHGNDGAGTAVGPALHVDDLTFEAFYEQVRSGFEGMHAFSTEELPDRYVLHLWAWLSETFDQAAVSASPSTRYFGG